MIKQAKTLGHLILSAHVTLQLRPNTGVSISQECRLHTWFEIDNSCQESLFQTGLAVSWDALKDYSIASRCDQHWTCGCPLRSCVNKYEYVLLKTLLYEEDIISRKFSPMEQTKTTDNNLPASVRKTKDLLKNMHQKQEHELLCHLMERSPADICTIHCRVYVLLVVYRLMLKKLFCITNAQLFDMISPEEWLRTKNKLFGNKIKQPSVTYFR